jgi:hypothetical protein
MQPGTAYVTVFLEDPRNSSKHPEMMTDAMKHPDQEDRTGQPTPEDPPSETIEIHGHILLKTFTRRKNAPTEATIGTIRAPYPIK